MLLSLLRLSQLVYPALVIAPPVFPGLCRVRMAKATRVRCLHRALPLLRAEAAHRVGLFHAQMVMAKRLTRALLLHRALRVLVCREGRAMLPARAPRLLDSCRELAAGCLLRARQHELAAERSLDFRF